MTYDDETFTARLPNGERVTCRVKRDINTNARRDTFKKIFEKAGARDDGDGNGGGASGHHLSQLADLLVESGNFVDRAHAIRHLLQHPSGHQLVRTHKGVEPMDRTAELRDIVKTHGPVALAKLLVEDGDSHGISEAELTDAITSHAKAQYQNLTEAQAFDKVFSASDEQGLLLRKAHALAKGSPYNFVDRTPMVTYGVDAMHAAVSDTESSEAYRQLEALIAGLRATSPWLTAQQLFAAVCANHPKNTALAARAVHQATGVSVLAAGATAFDELKAKAAELRKTQPNLTEAQAFDKVYTDPANIEIAKRERRESAPR